MFNSLPPSDTDRKPEPKDLHPPVWRRTARGLNPYPALPCQLPPGCPPECAPKNIYFKDDELKTLNQRIDYLAKFYHTHNDKNKNGKPIFEYDNPIVPFSVCSREIKYIFNFLKDITNKYSHFLKENPNYLGPGESAHQYNRLVKQSCYPAFFVAMKWYYNYMSKSFHKK